MDNTQVNEMEYDVIIEGTDIWTYKTVNGVRTLWEYSDDYLPRHLGALLEKIVKDARGGPLSLRVDEV